MGLGNHRKTLGRFISRVCIALAALLGGVVGDADTPAPQDEFVLIPGGSFQMGDTFGEGALDELPVHTVHVSPFYMQKTAVTKAQWDSIHEWAVDHGYKFDDDGQAKDTGNPAQGLDWYDAVKWCNARSEKEGLPPAYTIKGDIYRKGEPDGVECNWEGKGYRLPSEAEWEKAARGGLAGKRFPWGDTITLDQANYSSYPGYDYDITPPGSFVPNTFTTARVASHAPNGYGLYDMVGNTTEWCWDYYSKTYYGGDPPPSDPHGPSWGYGRIQRGGNWDRNAYYCRVACRIYNLPESGTQGGFRCVHK